MPKARNHLDLFLTEALESAAFNVVVDLLERGVCVIPAATWIALHTALDERIITPLELLIESRSLVRDALWELPDDLARLGRMLELQSNSE